LMNSNSSNNNYYATDKKDVSPTASLTDLEPFTPDDLDDAHHREYGDESLEVHEELVRRLSREMDFHIQDFHNSHKVETDSTPGMSIVSENEGDDDNDEWHDEFDVNDIEPPMFAPDEWQHRDDPIDPMYWFDWNALPRDMLDEANECAQRVQRVVRGHLARLHCLRSLEAILCLQRLGRRIILQQQKEEEERQQRWMAVRATQTTTTGVVVITAVCYASRHIRAVTRIQALFRGHQQRLAFQLYRTVVDGQSLAVRFKSIQRQEQRRRNRPTTRQRRRNRQYVVETSKLVVPHWSATLLPETIVSSSFPGR